MQNCMIYGANGYTGELIAREAAARRLRPVLTGRNAAAVAVLADELGLAYRSFPARAPALAEVGLVLNCAGPFSATAAPLMRACLEGGAHYLDITGEIDVFEHAQTLSSAARTAGVVICPGVGFDVIPTDCLARALVEVMPDATHLALGFETVAAMSPGTAKTSVEGLAHGGRVRRDGKIVGVPMGVRTRQIDFGQGPRTGTSRPWKLDAIWQQVRQQMTAAGLTPLPMQYPQHPMEAVHVSEHELARAFGQFTFCLHHLWVICVSDRKRPFPP